MKKLFIAAIVLIFSACATTNNSSLVNEPPLSAENFVSSCGVPLESYFIQQLGVKVHRHKKCMGINDLLSIIWAEEKLTKNSIDGVTLLAITYTTHLSHRDGDFTYFARLVNIDSFIQRNIKTHVAFFELKRR